VLYGMALTDFTMIRALGPQGNGGYLAPTR
jgi:hypothetical protein